MHAVALALLSALLFGAATPASKQLLRGLEPLALAALLYLGAALGTAPVAWLERRRGARIPPDRRSVLRLLGAIALGGVAAPLLMLLGLRASPAGTVSLWLNLELVATALLGVAFFREPLGRAGAAAVACALAASALLAGAGGWPGAASAALVAAACVCWGLDNHWTALIDGLTPAASTFAKGLAAGSVNLALALAWAPPAAPPATLAAALATGALCYGASIALYIEAAQALGATRAQALFASAPFLGALLSFTLLGEPFGAAQAAALPLLAVSVGLLLASRHQHAHVHEATEHVHPHAHDDGHHLHPHPGLAAGARHTHPHRHERVEHAHPHWPDVHHRHAHRRPPAR